MIYFLTDRIGGENGGSRAGVDILEACLLSTASPLTVVGTVASDVPGRLRRRAAEPPRWLKIPRYIQFPQKVSHRLIKHLAKWLIFNTQDLTTRLRFEKQLRRDRPALVLYNDFPHPHTKVFEKLRRSGKSVMIMHISPKSLAFFQRTHDPAYTEAWALELLAAFDAFIFVSANTRDAWLIFEPLRNKPSFVIPNCCREDEARLLSLQTKLSVRAKLGVLPDHFVASCVATVQPNKGQDMLIEALPEIVAAIPNFRLYLVGARPASPWAEALQERISQLNLTPYVEFAGYREDGMSFTYASDLLVLPSRAESQPLVILEAMALGVPVVATNVDGIPDMIQDGVEGKLFAPDKISDLAAHVLELYRDQVLRETLAKCAAEKYWREFSKARQISRYREVIPGLLTD